MHSQIRKRYGVRIIHNNGHIFFRVAQGLKLSVIVAFALVIDQRQMFMQLLRGLKPCGMISGLTTFQLQFNADITFGQSGLPRFADMRKRNSDEMMKGSGLLDGRCAAANSAHMVW